MKLRTGRGAGGAKGKPHHPHGDDRERITGARQAAEALFTPKRQPVEPSVSESVPSAERSARKPRVLAILSPAPSGPAVATCAHPNLGAVRVDRSPSRRGLWGRRRRD